AKQRMHQLIETMVEIGVKARISNQTLSFPAKILQTSSREIQTAETDWDTHCLYPNNPVFQNTQVSRLQQELNQAIARLNQLPNELQKKHEHIEKQKQETLQIIESKKKDLESKDTFIDNLVEQMDELLMRKSEIIQRKNEHIESLSEMFSQANAELKSSRARYAQQAIKLNDLKEQIEQFAASIRNLPSQQRAA
ncbi:hypothetical protein OAU26_05525, partial [Mariniblastus sp.]|nr:hypothetical protein [Mariniblastus sp.]